MSSKPSHFKFVLIPADDSSPIVTKEGSTSGGLENDYLQNEAKDYFWKQYGSHANEDLKVLDRASSSERHAFAQRIRSGSSGAMSEHIDKMSDDDLINMVRTAQGTASTEISAVTIPTPTNSFNSVSMYSSPNAERLPFNSRATALLKACGHQSKDGIRGDVFVGRCIDDEIGDVWTRVDFTAKDADPSSDWCLMARESGGGGGKGGEASSLSNLMGGATIGMGGADAGEEKKEGKYVWSQTDDEVEIKFVVAPYTKKKDIGVKFGRKNLKITLFGNIFAEGDLGGTVDTDECTYTIQDVKDGKEICLTLTKKDEGIAWGNALTTTSEA